MTPEIFNKSKNLFLLFSPGCGGNHLANMLSLHPEFEPRFNSENYEQEMIDKYCSISFDPENSTIDDCAGPIVHFSELQNLQPSGLLDHKQEILASKRKYIFCAHVEEYFYRDEELAGFDCRFFILFTLPKTNKLLLKRIENNSSWYINKTRSDYMPILPESYELMDSVGYGIPNDSIFQIESDIFYTVEGFDYIQGELNKHFGITLPETCRDLHNRYISIQKTVVEAFDK